MKTQINPAIEIVRSRMFEIKTRIDLYDDDDKDRTVSRRNDLIKLYKLSALLYSKLVGMQEWKNMYETMIHDYRN